MKVAAYRNSRIKNEISRDKAVMEELKSQAAYLRKVIRTHGIAMGRQWVSKREARIAQLEAAAK